MRRTSKMVLTVLWISVAVLPAMAEEDLSVRNLLFASCWNEEFSGGRVAFRVSEEGNGVDLNGDGDANDCVLHLHDLRTGGTTNLGYAVHERFVMVGKWLVFAVEEEHQGETDLDGDGERRDRIFHVYDAERGMTHNLEVAAPSSCDGYWIDVIQNRVAFVSEGLLHVLDPSTGEASTLGDVMFACFPGCVCLCAEIQAAGNWLVFLSSSGLLAYDVVTGLTRKLSDNTEVYGYDLASFAVAGNAVGFSVLESARGQDLNDDGDLLDRVFHVHDLTKNVTMNLRLAVPGPPDEYFLLLRTDGTLSALGVSESGQGDTDLNDDGDTDDTVLHVHDARGGAIVKNLGFSIGDFGRLSFFFRSIRGFSVPETEQGRDLNGDGDTDDAVVHVYDERSGEAVNLELAGTIETDVGQRVVFSVNEQRQGKDLNDDEDRTDAVLHVYDSIARKVTNLGLPRSGDVRGEERYAAFPVSENAHGNTDLNGDDDATDDVMHVLDFETGEVSNLRLAGRVSRSWRNGLSLHVDEREHHQTDLNEDGDIEDWALHFLCLSGSAELPLFLRGDCNDDGNVDISDAVFSLGSLFLGDGDPGCDDACDSNDDSGVDVSDAINTLGVIFLGQGTIPLPGMTEC